MASRRCSSVLDVASILLEGLAMLALVLLWIALSELRKAFEGGAVVVEACDA